MSEVDPDRAAAATRSAFLRVTRALLKYLQRSSYGGLCGGEFFQKVRASLPELTDEYGAQDAIGVLICARAYLFGDAAPRGVGLSNEERAIALSALVLSWPRDLMAAAGFIPDAQQAGRMIIELMQRAGIAVDESQSTEAIAAQADDRVWIDAAFTLWHRDVFSAALKEAEGERADRVRALWSRAEDACPLDPEHVRAVVASVLKKRGLSPSGRGSEKRMELEAECIALNGEPLSRAMYYNRDGKRRLGPKQLLDFMGRSPALYQVEPDDSGRQRPLTEFADHGGLTPLEIAEARDLRRCEDAAAARRVRAVQALRDQLRSDAKRRAALEYLLGCRGLAPRLSRRKLSHRYGVSEKAIRHVEVSVTRSLDSALQAIG